MKQFWTSTTISADFGPGLMVPAARAATETGDEAGGCGRTEEETTREIG